MEKQRRCFIKMLYLTESDEAIELIENPRSYDIGLEDYYYLVYLAMNDKNEHFSRLLINPVYVEKYRTSKFLVDRLAKNVLEKINEDTSKYEKARIKGELESLREMGKLSCDKFCEAEKTL